jgi:opacity protein-like surface antigen
VRDRILVAAAAAMFFVLACRPAAAQTPSFSIKVGAPLNDSFVTRDTGVGASNFTFETKRYTLGPSFELSLPFHLGVEADALYKRSGYERPFFDFTATTKVNTWEFPILAKVRFPGEVVGAFGDIGASFRHASGTTTYDNGFTPPLDRPFELDDPWSHGFVVGGGASFLWGSVHFEPEIRYTRWGNESFNVPGAFMSNPDQVDYLLGIRFGK